MAATAVLDRTGVWASILCAIHCGVAPILLLAAPALGGAWSHPASHAAIAAFVLPVAATALIHGVRTHGKKRVLALGIAGMLLVAVGVAIPYWSAGEAGAAAACIDQCCPSFVDDPDTGARTLHLPPASIATFAGGLLLIGAHLLNLRCCAGCRVVAPA